MLFLVLFIYSTMELAWSAVFVPVIDPRFQKNASIYSTCNYASKLPVITGIKEL
jgi:hypothetical protein